MPRIQESMGALGQAKTGSGRILVQIINAGKGSTAYYPEESLKRVAESKVFKKGTHMYVDHPTPSEWAEKPERSLTTLAASLAEDAYWDPTSKALLAEAKLYSTYRDVITEMAEDIGVSILADAQLDAEGNLVTITEAHSVDFVTKAGRGGKVVQVMESARAKAEQSGPEATLREATDNDVRDYLRDAVLQAHPSPEEEDGPWAHMLDFDEDYVYFEILGGDTEGIRTYRQGYTRNGVEVQLTGVHEEVKRETSYTPLAHDAGTISESASSTDPRPMEEITVVDIEESEYTRLQESAGRAEALEQENETLRRTLVEAVVSEEFGEIEAPRTRKRLIAEALGAKELDVEAFRTEVRETAAEFTPPSPDVSAHGFGETQGAKLQESEDMSDEEYEKAILEAGKG